MGNGEKRPTQGQILISAFLIAIIMFFSFKYLPTIIKAITPTPYSSLTQSSLPIPTPVITGAPSSGLGAVSTSDPIQTSTPRYFPKPIIGVLATNLPSSFKVGKWYDNSCTSDAVDYVEIYGVDISGGTPPYKITFWENGMAIASYELTPQNEFVHLIPPVKVKIDKYLTVTIAFNSEAGASEWIDDLRYPSCLNP